MPKDDNIIPFRPRRALSVCSLPEYDDEYNDETVEDAVPVESQHHSINLVDGEGGNSLLDACLPTHIAREALAFIMERLAEPATP